MYKELEIEIEIEIAIFPLMLRDWELALFARF